MYYDHHDKPSNDLSPYEVLTILLTIFLMLYITSLWLTYFITGGLCLLMLFTYFTLTHTLPSGYHHLFSLSVSLFSFCFVSLFCFSDSTYKWNHTLFVFLWLTLSIILSRSIMLLQMAKFHSFYGWVVFCYIYVPYLLQPFLCWWTFRLLPCLGYCK